MKGLRGLRMFLGIGLAVIACRDAVGIWNGQALLAGARWFEMPLIMWIVLNHLLFAVVAISAGAMLPFRPGKDHWSTLLWFGGIVWILLAASMPFWLASDVVRTNPIHQAIQEYYPFVMGVLYWLGGLVLPTWSEKPIVEYPAS